MINTLIELLAKEEVALKGLLDILDEQHENIVKKNVFVLEDIVEKIKDANIEVAKIEVERRKLIGNNSMKDFVANSNNEELDTAYRSIKRVLNEITLQKETNEILIKQGLVYTSKILNLINPKRDTVVYSSYGTIKR